MTPEKTVLLDTTVVIDVLRNRKRRRQFLASLVNSQHNLVTSTITVAEVHAGLRAGEEEATRALLAELFALPVSKSIAERAGLLKAEFKRTGQTRSITDMIVAATALENGFAVATDNIKDFQIPGLNLLSLS